MADKGKQEPVTIQELLISSLAMIDALATILIEKGIVHAQIFVASLAFLLEPGR